MITILTGTPGAGKTLYAVTKLVQPLVGTSIKHQVNGAEVELPRTIYTNIKGFVLDHELIDGSNTGGLQNWHQWAKPGSVIVFDEVQKVWEPRANGSKVPDDIKALETHRHMGVDFILITQGLALTERNLAMLCNRHLHVRRVGNVPFAIVYEWDHASRSLLYSKALATQKWFYDRKGYKLYKSAEVHTKQPRSVPRVLIGAVIGMLALAFLVPTFKARLSERFGWGDASKVSAVAAKPPGGLEKVIAGPLAAASAPVAFVAAREEPKFLGCAATVKRCSCFDAAGNVVDRGPGFCKVHTEGVQGPPISLAALEIPEQDAHRKQLELASRDAELLSWAGAREAALTAQSALHALPAATPSLLSKTPERSVGTVAEAKR